MLITPNNSTKRTNRTGSLTTLGGSYNQGKMVTEHVPSRVNNLQVNNTHIGRYPAMSLTMAHLMTTPTEVILMPYIFVMTSTMISHFK